MTPNLHIEVDVETAEALAKRASSAGMTVPEYLRRHFADVVGPRMVEHADRWLDELADGMPDITPLPSNFSSRDVYTDHD